MKKALLVATVYGFIASFEQNNIRILQELGYEVWCACNMAESDQRLADLGVWTVDVPFERNPFGRKNMIAYKCLKEIIKKEKFNLIHCHTPVGGVLGRMAASACGVDRIIYTAHGFHFYQGAPKVNWLLYYPIEWWLAWKTDLLITINQEDYERAKRHFHAKKVEYVPGVGVDVAYICGVVKSIDRRKKREELNIPQGAFLILSVGELNKNKNHRVVLEALKKLEVADAYYIICGKGVLEQELQSLVESLGLEEKVKLLGYRKDVIEIMACANLYVHPSFREGLPVSVMEAMAVGLPLLCSDIRGNRDLVQDHINGLLVSNGDFIKALDFMYQNRYEQKYGENSFWIIQDFNLELVLKRMRVLYC